MNMNRWKNSKNRGMNEYEAIRRGFITFPHDEAPRLRKYRKIAVLQGFETLSKQIYDKLKMKTPYGLKMS